MYFYLLKIPNKIPSFVVLGLQLTVQWSKVYLRNRTHGSIKHVMITLDVKILGFKPTIKKWLHNAILWSRFSGIAKGGTLPGVPEPPLGYSMGYNFKRNEILAVKENEKKINWKKHQILFRGLHMNTMRMIIHCTRPQCVYKPSKWDSAPCWSRSFSVACCNVLTIRGFNKNSCRGIEWEGRMKSALMFANQCEEIVWNWHT